MTERLSTLPNIGAELEKKLSAVGIETPQQLMELGSRGAFLRLRRVDAGACLSCLCGLEGAVLGVRWHQLPPEVKAELKAFLRSLADQ